MRTNFQNRCPGAFVTASEEEFLRQDFDAVLLATFCPAHGPHAIKCLQAGKHVLSEVTSFFTLAEGVKLVEEVEKRKLVYNLAENYPFSAANMWLANRWEEGLFGEMMYAEYEYVHECRMLCYTYTDGVPIIPGHTVHNWRSWFNFHYYCTHSLGPVMAITKTRPVAVEAFSFSATMKDMVIYAPLYRAYADWKKVEASLANPAELLPVARKLLDNYDKLVAAYRDARAIVKAHPDSDGAKVLSEMLEVGKEKTALSPAFLAALKKDVARLRRKYSDRSTLKSVRSERQV